MTKIQINYLSTSKTSIFMYSLVVMFSILSTKLGWVRGDNVNAAKKRFRMSETRACYEYMLYGL